MNSNFLCIWHCCWSTKTAHKTRIGMTENVEIPQRYPHRRCTWQRKVYWDDVYIGLARVKQLFKVWPNQQINPFHVGYCLSSYWTEKCIHPIFEIVFENSCEINQF